MAKTPTKTPETKEIHIQRLEVATAKFYILGSSPLVMNRMTKKAIEYLLLPPIRKLNAAEKAQVMKHNPPEEFRDSVYLCRDPGAPTMIHIPDNAFKKAMVQAALDTPGATKAAVGRLVKIVDTTVHLYGKPFLYMAWVRQAGVGHTPDVRTRAIFPLWCCQLTVQYIKTLIREQDIVNLMANAGLITGVGDGRTEKGTFNFGGWDIVGPDDPQWLQIQSTQGRKVQIEALKNIETCHPESEELLRWFYEEMVRRERQPAPVKKPPAKKAKGNGKGATV